VDGQNISFDAYLIEGNNYFKLRDLAFTLSGTSKQFDVSWDGAANAISLTSGQPYTVAGGEMTAKGSGPKDAAPTTSRIIKDGRDEQFIAYNIEGNNYFKLRDIGTAFDFGVDWDGARNTVVIDTSKGYSVDGSATAGSGATSTIPTATTAGAGGSASATARVTKLPASITDRMTSGFGDALAVAKKYHEYARPKMEPTMVPTYNEAVTWTPEFTAASPLGLPRGMMLDIGLGITLVNAPYYNIAYSTAAYARDPGNPFSAGMAGTAIAQYGDRQPNAMMAKPYREDSLTMMHYALYASL
jgi:hypothetical protein